MFLSLLTNKWRRKLCTCGLGLKKSVQSCFFECYTVIKKFLKWYSFQNQLFVNIFFLYPSTDAGLWSRLSKCCRFYRLFLYGLCVSVGECQNAKNIWQSNKAMRSVSCNVSYRQFSIVCLWHFVFNFYSGFPNPNIILLLSLLLYIQCILV